MPNLCIHLTDEELINKIKIAATGEDGIPRYKKFVMNILNDYFNNRIVQLKLMGIDELAKYALKLEEAKEEKQKGEKNADNKS